MQKYCSYRGEIGKIAPDLLECDFESTAPNRKWVTDVAEFSLFGQKLYLSPILDLYSRDIISYTISDSPVLFIVTDMLNLALQQISDGAKLIQHSDQGWQYQQSSTSGC